MIHSYLNVDPWRWTETVFTTRSILLENIKCIRAMWVYNFCAFTLYSLLRFTAQFTLWALKIKKVYSSVYFFHFRSPDVSMRTLSGRCDLVSLYAFSRRSPKPKSYKLCSIKTNVRYLTPKCPSSILQASQINPNTILFCCFLTETEHDAHWTIVDDA